MNQSHAAPHHHQIIELHSQRWSDRQIAKALGLGVSSVRAYRSRVLSLPAVPRQQQHRSVRSDCSIGSHAETIRQRWAQGYSDAEIAAEIGVKREAVGYYRRRHLGLPTRPRKEHVNRHRARRSQERSMGCTPADVRADQLWSYAINLGWPAGLRMRAAQILELLCQQGPLTREQIRVTLGLSLKQMQSNDPQGTYLANLISRGLVTAVARAVPTGRPCKDGLTRKGTAVHLYFPAPLALELKARWRESQSKTCLTKVEP